MYHKTNSVSIISKETQYLQHIKANNMESYSKYTTKNLTKNKINFFFRRTKEVCALLRSFNTR